MAVQLLHIDVYSLVLRSERRREPQAAFNKKPQFSTFNPPRCLGQEAPLEPLLF